MQGEGHHQLLKLKRVDSVPEEPNDPVSEITDLEYDHGFPGHFLLATVQYGGGMAKHDFEAYWDGSWMKSMPPGVRIELRHNANGDLGKALPRETLQIDIAELIDTGEREFWVTIHADGVGSDRLDVVVGN